MSGLTTDRSGQNALASKLLAGGIILTVAGASITAVLQSMGGYDLRRMFFSLLLNFCYFLSLSLGALLWVVLHHLTRAGWSVTLRRFGEAVASSVSVFALIALAILIGMPLIYSWARADIVQADAILQSKAAYLNVQFFTARSILYFLVWSTLAWYYLRCSIRQDATGDFRFTVKMERISPIAMILLALTITFFSFDYIMSLDPHWFSTIFGVYYFSGCMAGWFALLGLVGVFANTRMGGIITVEHLHDVGKLMFTFVVFWAYIAFSQYMLIWYANLPEETVWIARRQQGGWMQLTYILLIGHFIIPFLGLLSRYPKRRRLLLPFWAVWILVMHWLDLYWLIMPEYQHGTVTPGFAAIDFSMILTIGGLFIIGSSLPLRNNSLVPTRDPRLAESLAFENM